MKISNSVLQFAVAAAISPSLETEFDDSRTAFLCRPDGDPNQFSNHMANNSRNSTRNSAKTLFFIHLNDHGFSEGILFVFACGISYFRKSKSK